tara:strand:+ start:1305 stop:2714 length:1410 start_codon:yes stop_codon:yes gene_type:complete
MIDILLPELGEGISNVEIRDVLVKKGDSIKKDQVILVLETDKASMEIPSEHDGVISELYIKTGDKISPNEKILTLNSEADDSKQNDDIIKDAPISNEKNIQEEAELEEQNEVTEVISSSPPPPVPSPIPSTSSLQSDSSIDSNKGDTILASPSTRKLARELGCDIKLINGTGKKGRVSREDVLSYINRHLSSNPNGVSSDDLKTILKDEISSMKDDIVTELSQQDNNSSDDMDYSKWGLIELEPLSKIKKITGSNMANAWATIPQVTQFDNADISNLYKSYKRLKKENTNPEIKVSLIPFYIKVLTKALQSFPNFNSSLNSKKDAIIIKKYINVGVAVDTERGLVVPVIKNCDKKSLKDITIELSQLAEKAHSNKLSMEDIDGGTITISSLGGIGGTNFTPIVNPPQVAILGFSKAEYNLIYEKDEFVKKLILPFSLTYDHRVIDGAQAVKFTTKLKELLSSVKLIGKK